MESIFFLNGCGPKPVKPIIFFSVSTDLILIGKPPLSFNPLDHRSQETESV